MDEVKTYHQKNTQLEKITNVPIRSRCSDPLHRLRESAGLHKKVEIQD